MNACAAPVHIAVVDDNDTLRELFVRCLQRSDRVVWSAANSAGLDEVLAKRPVDIVVMEMHLPDADGHAMVPRLKHRYPDLKFVLLSARTEPSWIPALVVCDANACLVKPADLGFLECTVAEMVAQVRAPSFGTGLRSVALALE